MQLENDIWPWNIEFPLNMEVLELCLIDFYCRDVFLRILTFFTVLKSEIWNSTEYGPKSDFEGQLIFRTLVKFLATCYNSYFALLTFRLFPTIFVSFRGNCSWWNVIFKLHFQKYKIFYCRKNEIVMWSNLHNFSVKVMRQGRVIWICEQKNPNLSLSMLKIARKGSHFTDDIRSPRVNLDLYFTSMYSHVLGLK